MHKPDILLEEITTKISLKKTWLELATWTSFFFGPPEASWSCRPGWHRDVKKPQHPALLNHIIPCQLEAFRVTLLPGKMPFTNTTPTNLYFHSLTSPTELGLLPPWHTIERGLISMCLLHNAVKKIGPVTGQEKTLFWRRGVGPDGQMPHLFSPCKLGWMKSRQLQENCRGLEQADMFKPPRTKGFL